MNKKILLLPFLVFSLNSTIIYHTNPNNFILSVEEEESRLKYKCRENETLIEDNEVFYHHTYAIKPAKCKKVVSYKFDDTNKQIKNDLKKLNEKLKILK
jgi:hypothetical protein